MNIISRPQEEHHQEKVEISINSQTFSTHRGLNSVVHLKSLGGVTHDDELEEVRAGVPIVLKNDAEVEIKGGEVFVSREKHEEIVVRVTNENNGKHAEFKEKSQTSVSVVIELMYASPELGIGRARLPEDRLRCKDGGADILQYGQLTLRELQKKHCHSLHWKFAGPTGGAKW